MCYHYKPSAERNTEIIILLRPNLSCLTGTEEFRFGKMSTLWRRPAVMAAQQGDRMLESGYDSSCDGYFTAMKSFGSYE